MISKFNLAEKRVDWRRRVTNPTEHAEGVVKRRYYRLSNNIRNYSLHLYLRTFLRFREIDYCTQCII